jgi:hypothetical protein
VDGLLPDEWWQHHFSTFTTSTRSPLTLPITFTPPARGSRHRSLTAPQLRDDGLGAVARLWDGRA